MPRFIVSAVGIAFLKCANLETLEYNSLMVIWIFLLIGHIRILSIGNGRSFRGVSNIIYTLEGILSTLIYWI